MKNTIKLILATASVALLAACGGGGGSQSTGTENNPLSKYAGTFSGCDGYHKRTTTIFSTVGSTQLTMSVQMDVYENASCTGASLGTLRMPASILATFLSSSAATVTGITSSSQLLTIDKINVTAPASTSTLTGSGVIGRCVYYTNGNLCFDTLINSATDANAGFYLSGNTIYTLTVNGGTYKADDTALIRIN
ncbi:hypothetical protein [Limnohabitans sp. Rim8]|uniref:hypothetical protein n=1 Tax=Limnohabitans sp. Rim8 TaxID=1100718 RepID=UPI0033065DF9